MANSKRRCRSCRDYFPSDSFYRAGYHSLDCLRNRKPAKKRSGRRNDYAAELDDAREAVRLRSRGSCEARIPGVCSGSAEHVHHRKLRSAGGDNGLTNLLDLCHACHGWIHAYPAPSYDKGWLVRSYSDPADNWPIIRA